MSSLIADLQTLPLNWKPDLEATLLFLKKEGKVLLIRKKRGIGAGKINGPGGKLEPGETPLQCIIREVNEELGIDVLDPVWTGEVCFSFQCKSVPDIRCFVFSATNYSGEIQETDEAFPLWTDEREIPYEEMWEDDRYWLPEMLAGHFVKAYFLFEGESLIHREVSVSLMN